uniref:Sphingomyelin phosphodiesterase 4 n=1 Tax=Clastoptera arizonana TaxID=38151 RepID=A0A1B6DPQ8_9HEMI
MMDNIFSLPLPQKLDSLTGVMEKFSNKELEDFLPLLVDNIFGESNGKGWGLRLIQYCTHPTEYDLLFKFLHPHGPVFRFCYKLLADTYLRYDYPLIYLPAKLKQLIEEGGAHDFYMDKIRYDHQTRQPVVLSLNPFEYYMFHFVFHLVNPWLDMNSQESYLNLQWQTLYVRLAEQYLMVFLPLDGSPVLPSITSYMVQSPSRSLPIYTPNKPARTPTLFKQDVLMKHSPVVHSSVQTAPHLEIWRSQLLAQLCVEFWLCVPDTQNNWPRQTNQSGISSQLFSPLFKPTNQCNDGLPSSLDRRFERENSTMSEPSSLWPQQSLPTGEHLRVVRLLIKHLHYFANSLVEDSTAMNELKRSTIPSSQNKIYKFLLENMRHWPLDASFRLILESWLSYIQPWRYTDITNSANRQEGDERTVVDRKWITFIAENLLSYTYLFKLILVRFSRLDLSSPKNAIMFFRVTKIFSQPNLNVLLKEVESSLEENSHNIKWASIARTQFLESEGPGFRYSPLFNGNIKPKVIQYVKSIYIAGNKAQESIDAHQNSSKESSNVIIRWLLSNSLDSEYNNDERKRVPMLLETSTQYMCQIFDIDENSREDIKKSMVQRSFLLNSSGFNQSPMFMQNRLRNMKYQGDPDLKPIQSFEVAFLVRSLYHLASWFNLMYGEKICEWYTKNNLLGGIVRQIFLGPTTIFYYDKSSPGYSPRLSKTLPPRLSLRFWSNYKLLAFMLILYLLLKFLFQWPIILVVFVVLVVWLLYLMFNVLIGRVPSIPNLNNINDISMFN